MTEKKDINKMWKRKKVHIFPTNLGAFAESRQCTNKRCLLKRWTVTKTLQTEARIKTNTNYTAISFEILVGGAHLQRVLAPRRTLYSCKNSEVCGWNETCPSCWCIWRSWSRVRRQRPRTSSRCTLASAFRSSWEERLARCWAKNRRRLRARKSPILL